MNTAEAVELIGGAIPRRAGTWADLGAGDGTFTRALVELLGLESREAERDRTTQSPPTTGHYRNHAAEFHGR